MPHKSDARPRKPSRDLTGSQRSSTPNKIPKEGLQSAEPTTPKRKTDEEINIKNDTQEITVPKSDIKPPKSIKSKGRSVSIEDIKEEKNKINENETTSLKRTSPRKSVESKHKITTNRRMSVKEIVEKPTMASPKDTRELLSVERHSSSRHESLSTDREPCLSPIKKRNAALGDSTPSLDIIDKKHIPTNDDFEDADKNWLPKAPSPNIHPPPVEKPGDHEKYMTEDKSLDSDCADKSSIKMIAKIQANLNENTMIKSPKTPMDARTIDPIDVDNSITRNKRKRSLLDTDKKYITQDSSHVQGVEISKSAKIPSAVNPFPNRTMFSPQPKDNELFEFDILAVDEGFNHEEMMKPFTSYPEIFLQEDSKEQGVQETLNLVDRLRMQLNKKAPAETVMQEDEMANEKTARNENSDIISDAEKTEHNKNVIFDLRDKRTSPKENQNSNHFSEQTECIDASREMITENKDETKWFDLNVSHNESQLDPINESKYETASNTKWVDLSISHNESQLDQSSESKYDTTSYIEDVKEPTTVQSIHSISEVTDSISLSKQSDDSQSLSVVDHSVHSNDQELTQDNQTYDNNNSVIHSDCATISSPYIGHASKWGESKITTRRSSASSTNSEGSVCSQRANIKAHLIGDTRQGPVLPEIDAYPPIPAYSCRVEPTMPLNQYTSYPPEASPFLGTMGSLPLFGPGTCASSQLSLPSPAPGLYATGLPFATPLLQPIPKQTFPLCAAFTSSSQNIALTTAMIASPTQKPLDSPRDDIDVTGSDKLSIHVVSSPSISVDSYNEASNTRAPTKISTDSSETNMSLPQSEPPSSKSSPKQMKLLTKFPSKSPGKSPGISPKQSDSSKSTKRPSNKSNRSQRGRGRSKSRGQGYPPADYLRNSIQNKLIGTVYDFNEDIANDGVDLKALRERRKSIDRDDRKSEHSYKDSSQSPRADSPPAKRPVNENKEIKTSTPEPTEDAPSPSNKSNSERGPGFSQVQPVLPGPVDMRTYNNPFETPVPPVTDAYHSHLLAFASGTADQQLGEIDEEMEKQLHSALMASKPKPGTPAAASVQEINEPAKDTITHSQLPKVSLSDSRNQLKVKIKGPFLDANYASSVQPVAPQPPAPIHESNANSLNTSSSSTSSMMSGTPNLRRMRKKELLRQYWTQDMNMDDPTNASTMGVAPPPVPQPLGRAVITIPKAVASMTSIPTREDYKITDAPVEKKKRKITGGVCRELRQLQLSMNIEDDKLSSLLAQGPAHKRRARVTTKSNPSRAASPVAPKLKIKLGSNTVQQVSEEPSDFQFRPPKKRLQSIHKPSFEDLRRESMKYRRKVMADFEEDEKVKKHKPNKSEKRKKKKEKKSEKEKLQVINSESESATKLIIKIKRTNDEERKAAGAPVGGTLASAAAAAPEPTVDPFDYDPTAPDPLAIDPPFSAEASTMRRIRTDKVTPIRLKLARSSQGVSEYVMKQGAETTQVSTPSTSSSGSASAPAPVAPSASTSATAATSLPVAVNKHCEVR